MGVLGAVAGGYLAAMLVHLVLSFLITREGRSVLMTNGGMSGAFYLQTGLSWMVSGAAGSLVALRLSPEMPMAALALASIAGMLCVALVRVRNKVPHQQTPGDTLLLLVCVLVGLGVPAYLRLN